MKLKIVLAMALTLFITGGAVLAGHSQPKPKATPTPSVTAEATPDYKAAAQALLDKTIKKPVQSVQTTPAGSTPSSDGGTYTYVPNEPLGMSPATPANTYNFYTPTQTTPQCYTAVKGTVINGVTCQGYQNQPTQ